MTPAELKALVHQVAACTPGVGPLEESLKWGEQSFAPVRANIGSSVRIQPRDNGDIALMVICHTNLVEEFRALYPDTLTFEGNRAIVMEAGKPVDREALSHCIGLALTYKLRKRGKA
ncbi:MAG: DUF1801 domain-containing protein [Hoeflea sp.]|uniref:DUF1801 domain-containing protein n=1 Tax=Hoeflea sp. TaxID=1940281 RepID=UPI001D1BFD61|nr:DUF1801 domain-containing protein [Hoeflea sp.]MBU4529143.1 DUF1801 domain-containing protein [Alphaproteobacteria bacterium]MBU4543548.1 DUF1801 domain-containing protein [Alphaproteobacteria bacterium]MBU4549173.1 DUF1801 domain-containing protein [Alphaproteobacteria bacterium]MBV1725308.1 DUF1801 domain-containing protein [Hoeflea sp.]MBV1785269.1 DUF1801 domain-containing protein [Hoeflea sp.]